MADLGEGPGAPLIFRPTEARRVEKKFLETGSPLSQGLDDRLPLPPPPLSRGLDPALLHIQRAKGQTQGGYVLTAILRRGKAQMRIRTVTLFPGSSPTRLLGSWGRVREDPGNEVALYPNA